VTATAAHDSRRRDHHPARRKALAKQARTLIAAIRAGDEATVESAVLGLGRSRRGFAPLVFALGAFVMLFQGVKLLVSNWRLALIQVVPAMWIWLALLDLKAHAFKGKEFHTWHGAVEAALVAAIVLVTAASFYLNAVFAFAIATPGEPRIRPALTLAQRHLVVVLGFGALVGVALGFSAIVVPRWGKPWFTLSLGIVVGVMMLTYVTVPARLVGIKPTGSRRDKLAASAIAGTLGALVCTPPYVIGRIGILLLGSHVLFAVGVVLLLVGFTLQSGATGAVKAIKMSAKLAAGTSARPAGSPATDGRA
jgi:hypothetical protein